MVFALGPGTKSLIHKDHFKPILRKFPVFHMGAAGCDHIWAYFIYLKVKQIAIFWFNCTTVFLVKKEVGNQNFRSISLKLTELWHQYACPYMGTHAKFDFLITPDWPNYNIFWIWWNLFYMIKGHKLHIIVELKSFVSTKLLIWDSEDQKSSKSYKIAIISKREYWKTEDGKIQTPPRFFEFFSKFFL